MVWFKLGYVVESLVSGGKWCEIALSAHDDPFGYAEQRDAVVENISRDTWLVCLDWSEFYEVPNAWRVGRCTI